MKVYFCNSQGCDICLGNAKDKNEAISIIKNFCYERSFKIKYLRYYINSNNENQTIVDVGSWSEHFIIDDAKDI